ncbi:MAG TPA: hypothetical protein VFO41_02860 [Alphaproteobacteria bacterium]|nr:hypothetical protein [Alphaproteobacteria bacterium]
MIVPPVSPPQIDATSLPLATPVNDIGQAVAGGSAGVFEFAAPLRAPQPAIGELPPGLQGRLLANPSTLGEHVLRSLEGFHDRAAQARQVATFGPAQDAASGTHGTPAGSVLPGPAQLHPAAGAGGTAGPLDRTMGMMVRMFDFAIETHLVAKGGTQFSGTVNTLLKGQ